MPLFIGLPEWRHPDWYAEGANPNNPLAIYSKHFSTVEGNTTFYALPKVDHVKRWRDTVPGAFRFCFKFPKEISHKQNLRHCQQEVDQFLKIISTLEEKIGVLWLQMPPYFTVNDMSQLQSFFDLLPDEFTYGIEVRHLSFFGKDDREKSFNQLLMERSINRVMFDTRILFSHPAEDEETRDALSKKPRMPLHVLATGKYPMVRFISPMRLDLSESALDQWVEKTLQWLAQGKTPYLFFHTPNKRPAPKLAKRFTEKLHRADANIPVVTLWQGQPSQGGLF